MKELEKYITDENTGLKYELVGDYYFLSGDDEPEEHRPIGIWGCGCPVDTSAERRKHRPSRQARPASSSLPQAVQKDYIHGIGN